MLHVTMILIGHVICVVKRQQYILEGYTMNTVDTQHNNFRASVNMMGDLMVPGERILRALRNSRLVDNLNEPEIDILAGLMTVQYFEAQDFVDGLDDAPLKDALMILVEGKIEVSALVRDEPVSLYLVSSGDIARIISFVGDNMINVNAVIKIKQDSAVLLLQRSRLETLLNSHPSIVYGVLRNLVLHVHGVARRKSAEGELMKNYLYGMNGRY
jgi:CRP/FNR family cyclic AMP-dependent transcriptional regulator